jgi:hypothetical protein
MSADGNDNSPDLDAQLAAIRAKRAALAEAREQRAQPSAADQLAAEQRALADDEALERLELEHGPAGKAIEIVRTEVGGVIVRRPHMAVFRRFQDDNKDTAALEKLVRPCVLHPSKADFDRMCEELPFTLQRCADAVCRLAGIRKEDIQAKQ